MRKLKLEEEQSSKNRILRGIKAGAIIFLVVFFLEIWMVTRLSTYGHKIQELKVAKANLELENQIIENQIAEKSSLISLEEKAEAYGFSNIKNLEYVKPASLASVQ